MLSIDKDQKMALEVIEFCKVGDDENYCFVKEEDSAMGYLVVMSGSMPQEDLALATIIESIFRLQDRVMRLVKMTTPRSVAVAAVYSVQRTAGGPAP